MQKMILDAEPDLTEFYIPKNEKRKKLYEIVNGNKFDSLIMCFILLNILTMALTYETESAKYNEMLKNFNLIFTGIFILEALLKIFAGG